MADQTQTQIPVAAEGVSLADWRYLRGNVELRPGQTCWFWMGSRTADDYGLWSQGDRLRLAHRVVWEMAHGQPAGDRWVLQTCGTRCCVRPGHLRLGEPRGEVVAPKSTKLSAAIVRDIHASHEEGLTVAKIARRHRVTRRAVRDVLSGKTWSDVQI